MAKRTPLFTLSIFTNIANPKKDNMEINFHKVNESQAVSVLYGNLSVLEEYLWKDVFGLETGTLICSPLRNDKNPSFKLYIAPNNRIRYYDFSTKDSGDIIKFTQLKLHLSFERACEFLLTNQNVNLLVKQGIKNPRTKVPIYLSIEPSEFKAPEIAFWKRFYIKQSTLKKFNVYAVKTINMQGYEYRKIKPHEICFCFYHPTTFRLKIYYPETPYQKKSFLSNINNAEDILGMEVLPPKGDLLIITKSLKDVMVLYEIGFNAISPHGETVVIKENIINNLKENFTNIVCLFDNDKAGIAQTERYAQLYALPHILIPKPYKDIADYIEEFGKQSTINLLTNQLTAININYGSIGNITNTATHFSNTIN